MYCVLTYVTYEYEMFFVRTYVTYENVVCPKLCYTRKYVLCVTYENMYCVRSYVKYEHM